MEPHRPADPHGPDRSTSGPGQSFWTDGWDGYPAARSRLLRLLAQRRVSNPIVLGGDVHAFYAADLKLDFDDPGPRSWPRSS